MPAARSSHLWRRPARRSRRDAIGLRRLLLAGGGFTVDLRTDRSVARGIAVCADASAGLELHLDEWCDRVVARWLDAVRSRLTSATLVGGWLDEHGRCCIDLVHVYPPDQLGRAIEQGRAQRQRAAFDLEAGRLVVITRAVPDEDRLPAVVGAP